jgi:hypothetical protein
VIAHQTNLNLYHGTWYKTQPECHKPNSPWPGITKLFPARESSVNDIPNGYGKIDNLFLQCSYFLDPNEPGNISETKKELSEQYRLLDVINLSKKHIQLKMLNKIIDHRFYSSNFYTVHSHSFAMASSSIVQTHILLSHFTSLHLKYIQLSFYWNGNIQKI